MSKSLHNQTGGWMPAASTVQSLSELWNSTAARVDHSHLPRSARENIEQLSDAYLRGKVETGVLGISRCAALYEAIAERYPYHCPVLLCWAAWNKARSRALASNLIRRKQCRTLSEAKREIAAYPWARTPTFGSTAHRALAGWFYAYRRAQRASGAIRGAVQPTFKPKR